MMAEKMRKAVLAVMAGLLMCGAVSSASGAVLFEDNFNDGDANGWEEYDGVFSVVSGVYHVESTERWNDARAVAGDPNWTDYVIDLDFNNLTVDNAACVLFRVQEIAPGMDEGRYYQLHMNPNKVGFAEIDYSGGYATLLAEVPYTVSSQTWHHLQIHIEGTRATAYIDGENVLSYDGFGTYAWGRIGLKIINGGVILFDNVVVADLNPIAHWKFDEGAGSIAYDSAGDNDGALFGDTSWVTDSIDGYALYFDGSDDYVNCGNDNSLNPGGGDYSICAWVKTSATSDGTIIDKGWPFDDSLVLVRVLADGRVELIIEGTGDQPPNPIASSAVNDDSWHHIAVTIDRTNSLVAFYIDGADDGGTNLDFSGTNVGDINPTESFFIGRRSYPPDNHPFEGSIDDVRIYDRALSAEEIGELYQEGTGLIAHWKFDEGAGTIAYDSAGDNDGTLVNGPNWTTGQVGGALEFDGENDYVEIPDSASLDISAAITISVWINPSQYNGDPVILWKHDETVAHLNDAYGLRFTPAGEVRFHFGPNSHEATSGYGLQIGVWTHISVTFDDASDDLIFYKNGQFHQRIPSSRTINTNNAPLFIQAFRHLTGIYGHFPGKVDDVRIHDRALSGEEIGELYHAGAAETWYVNGADGNDFNDGRAPGTAFATIRRGLDAGGDGDTVIVADGTYTGVGNRNLDYGGRAITLRSENGPEVCIIDCENDGRGFYFHSGEDGNSVLDGFMITRGTGDYGGAVNCDQSGPTINDCIFIANSASIGAGAVRLRYSSGVVTNCVFKLNQAGDHAGALSCGVSDAWIEGCIFLGNSTQNYSADGGAMLISGEPGGTVINCLFAGNQTASDGGGGGIRNYMSSPRIINCTFANNDAEGGGAISNAPYCSPTIENCIFWNNSAGYYGGSEIHNDDDSHPEISYCDIKGGWNGSGVRNTDGSSVIDGGGNINADPQFVSSPLGDYFLSQVAAGQATDSPCVDAGSDTAAALGLDHLTTRTDRAVDVGTVDIGFHYTPETLVFYVDGIYGDDLNDGARPETAFATIQKGIDEAGDDDTVLVYPAEYEERLDFLGKAITVQSFDEPAVLTAPDFYAVSFSHGEEPDSVFKNFIVKDSYCGFLCLFASPTISQVTVVDCNNGAVADDGSDPVITNSIFWNNTDGDLFGCQAQYSFVQDDIEAGLVSHWKFDEGSGPIAYDSAGSNDGTLIGDPFWVSGKIGEYGLEFDGDGDYVDLVDGFADFTNGLSIALWTYPDYGSIHERFIEFGNGEYMDNILFGRHQSTYSLVFQAYSGSEAGDWVLTEDVIELRTWQHFAVTVNSAGDTVIYKNGIEISDGRTFAPRNVLRTGNYIGRSNWDRESPYKGQLDEIEIFSRALSDREIRQLYLTGSGPSFVDPANGDYHLKSEGWRWAGGEVGWTWDEVTSPCIDAGNPGTPLRNEPMSVPRDPDNFWGENIRVNMGAYGGTSQAGIGPHGWALLADLNNDGTVDWLDAGLWAQYWLIADEELPGDLDRSGSVDLADFALFGQDYWSETIWR